MTDTSQILSFIITALVIGLSIHFWSKFKNARKLRQQIVQAWGKVPKREYSAGELQSLCSYFDNIRSEKKDTYFVDDITWHDLDMDRVFIRLNSACSTVGEEYLMALLRQPICDEALLSERERLLKFFESDLTARTNVQYLLSRLGKVKFVNITDYFYDGHKRVPLKVFYYRLLSAFAFISPIIMAFNFNLGLPLFIISIVVNMTVYYKAKNDIGRQLDSISYILSLASCARKVAKLGIKELDIYNGAVNSCSRTLKSILGKGFNLLYSNGDVFLEYAKILFLKELIDYESIMKIISKHSDDFKKIYSVIGLLDSMAAIASYRQSLPCFSAPSLHYYKQPPFKNVSFVDLCHPLIDNPVPNSADIRRSVLITGSNASGKSTFLKTAAINAIFAQTIHTCLAREYNSCYFNIYSSMALKDDLLKNESYYITEIKSLKRIVDSVKDDVPLLCFIDEVLRGTNTIERIAASSQVLHHLCSGNCLCIAATHDIELTSMLSGSFENYHFQESFSGDEIVFDYKLYTGKSNTRNAIKLLKVMGYPASIVNNAEKAAAAFLQEGKWKAAGS